MIISRIAGIKLVSKISKLHSLLYKQLKQKKYYLCNENNWILIK